MRSARAAVRNLDAEIVFFNVVALPNIRQQIADKEEWIERKRAETKARKEAFERNALQGYHSLVPPDR